MTITQAADAARHVLDKYGLATLLVIIFVTGGMYDRYVWSTTIIGNQQTTLTNQARIIDNQERIISNQERILASMASLTAIEAEAQRSELAERRAVSELHGRQLAVMDRIIDRIDRMDRASGPTSRP